MECPLGSAACLLEPSLVRFVSLRQVGSFQPRFEIGVHAHWCVSFRTVSRIEVGSSSVSLLGRSFVVDRAQVFSRKACLNLATSVIAATKLQLSAGVGRRQRRRFEVLGPPLGAPPSPMRRGSSPLEVEPSSVKASRHDLQAADTEEALLRCRYAVSVSTIRTSQWHL